MRPTRLPVVLVAAAALGAAPQARAQSGGWGRVSLFLSGGQSRPADGTASLSSNEAVASLTLRSPERETSGFEYAFDGRGSTWGAGGEDRQDRFSLWDGWVGGRLAGGAIGLRVGQQWVTELGGLGSVGGALVEVRGRGGRKKKLKPRFGVFGGVEPKTWEAGWQSDVKKGGAYVALDGDGGRRHVLGFVTVRNGGLTERSVLSTTNFFNLGKTLFFYVAGEYDVVAPGGKGEKGLSYAFVNARWTVSSRLEVQGLYHRGRSYDARTLTEDQLAGRPIDPRLAAGFLFESAGGRVTVEVARGFRVFAGYAEDRGNREDGKTGRITAGVHASNVFRSGIDLTLSDNRVDRPDGGSFDSWYASVGRSFGRGVYVSLDYATALSVLVFAGTDGIRVETRPRTDRFSLNGNVNLGRGLSLLVMAERSRGDLSTDLRGTVGLAMRF